MTSMYNKLWLSGFFHSFPHINLTFQNTNSTFDPENRSYVESLIFLAALPVACCILLLLVNTCCVCVQCNKKHPKRIKTTCLRTALGILIFFAAGSAAVGFYGNEEVSKGVQTYIDVVEDADKTIQDAVSTLDTLDILVNNITLGGIVTLKHVFMKISNSTVRSALTNLTEEIKSEANGVHNDLNIVRSGIIDVNLKVVLNESMDIEFYRWIGTIIFFCWHFLLFLILLIGILKKSRCLLIMSLTLGFFTTLIICGGMGLYLGADMGLGDFCMDPERYIEKVASHEIDRTIVKAYLHCESSDEPKDFNQHIEEAFSAVDAANKTLTEALEMAIPFNLSHYLAAPVELIRNDLSYAMSNISDLSLDVRCKHIHENFIKAVNSICNKALIGASLILLVTMLIELCVIFILCCTLQVIILMKKRKSYFHVDDTDPFLPRPPSYNDYGTILPPNARSRYPGNSAFFPIAVNDMQTLPTTETPPPAYDPGNFAQQYNNLRSSQDSTLGSRTSARRTALEL